MPRQSKEHGPAARAQFVNEVDDAVQRFFDPMSWDDRRSLFVRHLAHYLAAFDAGLIDSGDLGDILDMFVTGFASEYRKSSILREVPELVMYLTEHDSRVDIEYAISRLREIGSLGRSIVV